MLALSTVELGASLLARALAQPVGPADAEPDFGIWLWVGVVLVVSPIVMYTLKLISERYRDRKTRQLVEASNREGPVPDLPPDFEVPQVVTRRSKTGYRR